MPTLLVAIIDDATKLWDVLDAWERIGIPGATIIDSSGLSRARQWRDDVPLFPSVRDLMQHAEAYHRTLWCVMEDESQVEALARATEAVVGPLDAPHTGIIFTLPVIKVWGLRSPQ